MVVPLTRKDWKPSQSSEEAHMTPRVIVSRNSACIILIENMETKSGGTCIMQTRSAVYKAVCPVRASMM